MSGDKAPRIDQLETQTVDNFKVQINTQADFLANNITPILSNSDQESQSVLNQLRQTLETFSSTAPARLEVINNAQTIIATNQGLDQSSIGNQQQMLMRAMSYSIRMNYAVSIQIQKQMHRFTN